MEIAVFTSSTVFDGRLSLGGFDWLGAFAQDLHVWLVREDTVRPRLNKG